jgi:hypothetical protein
MNDSRLSHRISAFLLILLLVYLTSCSLPFGGGGVPRSRDPEAAKLNAAETVAALRDPERAEEGVWSLLAHLGIGVYSGDGTPVMRGSETGEGDFWLYDFEVGLLAYMASQPAEPYAAYHALIADLGYPGTEAELLGLYREAYARHQDHIFVQLLNEMGMDFSSDQTLTPLQEWLLLLDTFVPPNGDTAVVRGHPTGSGRLMLQAPSEQGGPCGHITGSGITPYWSVLQSEADLGAYFAAVEYYYAIHGPMLASAAEASLTSSTGEVHEGHNSEGDRVEISLNVRVQYVPQASVPVAATSCGVLVNVHWQPLLGGLESVPVEWEIPDALHAHGSPEQMDPLTDGNGVAKLNFQLQEEEAAGIGPYKEEAGAVTALINLRHGYMSAGIVDERLLSFVPMRKEVGPQEILVSWHDSCHELTLWFTEELHQVVAMFSNDIFIEGPILIQIYPGGDPATLQGGGTLPVTGQGKADDCQFTNSGTDQVTVTGTVVLGEGEEPPQLKMTINHSLQIRIQGNKCGGGSPMTIPLGGVTLEMPMRDGEMQGGPISQPTVSGLATYTLEVPCWD